MQTGVGLSALYNMEVSRIPLCLHDLFNDEINLFSHPRLIAFVSTSLKLVLNVTITVNIYYQDILIL